MQIDERDLMFSRMSRKKGTKAYKDYYAKNPHLQEIDDKLRSLPELDSEDTAMYDKLNTPIVFSTFDFLSDIKHLVDGPKANAEKTEDTRENFTKKIKGLAKYYGAKLCGITASDKSYYYSHRGRDDESYGEEVDTIYENTIVFAVEMDQNYIHTAPKLPEAIEVTKGYLDTAIIGMILTYYIKHLGYNARNHMDGNYLTVLPLAAKKAGLGDIGRHGILITEEFGPRVRLGAVTTDLPLILDEKSDFNVEEFCEACEKCIYTCPGKAIPKEKTIDMNGIERWQIIQEQCYEKWRMLGTDCGICIAACPFSSNIPKEDIEKYKKNPSFAKEIVKKHEEKYPIRPFLKEDPDWL